MVGYFSNQMNFFSFINTQRSILIYLLITLGFVSFAMSEKLLMVDFEVFGRVQGVFFRKYTEQQAKKLGLKGWCMNTERGTVQGQLQGPDKNIAEMKQWLKTTGSPSSRIEKTEFKDKPIDKYSFSDFKIRR